MSRLFATYWKLVLNITGLISATILVIEHNKPESMTAILVSIIALVTGYILGRWTCHVHQREQGFWVTITLFISLNLIHSMMDGISLEISRLSPEQIIAVLSHEGARQPVLYIILGSMITPFISLMKYRWLLLPAAITGVWCIGLWMGQATGVTLQSIEWLSPITDIGIFLFLGDIIHHTIEEYQKVNRQTKCCHH